MKKKFLYFLRYLAASGMFIILAGCATKGFVKQQTEPLSDRMATVESRLDALQNSVGMQNAAINDLKADVAEAKKNCGSAMSNCATSASQAEAAAARAEAAAKQAETAAEKSERAFRLRQRK